MIAVFTCTVHARRSGDIPGTFRGWRAGWTLVEILVVLGIFSVVLGLMMSFYYSGRKQSRVLDFRLQALQSTYLLRARLADDLASALPAPAGAVAVKDASGLRLRRVRRAPGDGPGGICVDRNFRIESEDVEYVFDDASHRVYRNGRAIGEARFLDVTFGYFPLGGSASGGCDGELVELHVTAVPERDLDDPTRTEFPRQVMLSFAFHVPRSAVSRAYPEALPLTR